MCYSLLVEQFYFIYLFLKNIYLFIYLAVQGLSCGMRDLCCHVWDLSLRPVGSSSLTRD